MSEKKAALPKWLQEALPPLRPPLLIDVVDASVPAEETVIQFVYPDGTRKRFANIQEAYEAAKDEKSSKFTKAFEDKFGVHGFVSLPANRGYSYMWLASDDQGSINRLTSEYEHFLETADKWFNDQEDWVKAYNFIDGHPAFWIHRPLDSEEKGLYWDLNGHTQRVHHEVYVYDEKPLVCLETGAHVATPDKHSGQAAYTSHYHDYRLDVSEPSFEAAWIALAKAVNKVFDLEGEERPGADEEFEKPEWLKEVERRIDALPEEKDEGDEPTAEPLTE